METGNAQVSGGPRAGQFFFVCWDRDGGRPSGRMILCGGKADVDGWGSRARVVCPPPDGH